MSKIKNNINEEQLMEDEKIKQLKEDPNVDHVFDYNSITDEHKKAVKEVLSILEKFGYDMVSDMIKLQFGIIQRPKYDLATSEFVKCCERANILTITQGYIIDNNVEYPVVFIQDDIRKLNDFIEKVKSGSY
jgi:hypothetical protein